jgi:tetratricopeptide (TPR) repeat protein
MLPERLRGFLAARLWEKADKLMHAGPSLRLPENFIPGSYMGNTEILPLLKMIVYLAPEETAPRLLLAENLGKHLAKRREAIKILQQGIINNPYAESIHELYATIAILKIFAKNSDLSQKRSALKYLNAAIKRYKPNPEKEQLKGHNIESYSILTARLNIELDKPQKALQAWTDAGLSLENDSSRLAQLLKEYRDTGTIVENRIAHRQRANFSPSEQTLENHAHQKHKTRPHDSFPGYGEKLIWLAAWLVMLSGIYRIHLKHKSVV